MILKKTPEQKQRKIQGKAFLKISKLQKKKKALALKIDKKIAKQLKKATIKTKKLININHGAK